MRVSHVGKQKSAATITQAISACAAALGIGGGQPHSQSTHHERNTDCHAYGGSQHRLPSDWHGGLQ
jgi:hypothetical protein